MRIRLAPGTTLTSVEGKDVLFSVKTGESFGLNETAAHMLKLSLEASLADVATKLAGEYDVDRAEILGDLQDLVTELLQAKMVESLPGQGE